MTRDATRKKTHIDLRREDPIAAPPDCPQHFRFGVVVGRAARLVDAAVRHERQEAAAGRER